MFTYTNDERFTVLHAEGSDDWTLQIKYVQKRDNGTYECQVSKKLLVNSSSFIKITGATDKVTRIHSHYQQYILLMGKYTKHMRSSLHYMNTQMPKIAYILFIICIEFLLSFYISSIAILKFRISYVLLFYFYKYTALFKYIFLTFLQLCLILHRARLKTVL